MPNDFPDWSTPATFLSNFLVNQAISPGNQIGPLDISLYQSIQLNLTSLAGSAPVSVVWYDAFNNQLDIEYLVVLSNNPYNVVLPCIGTRLVIQNNSAGTTISVSVEGSTRAIDKLSFPGSNATPWQGIFSGAVGSGSEFFIPPIIGAPTFTTFNGECQFDALSTTVPGFLIARTFNSALQTMDQVVGIVGTTSTHIIGRYVHPAQPVQWAFYPTANGTTSISVLITGSG